MTEPEIAASERICIRRRNCSGWSLINVAAPGAANDLARVVPLESTIGRAAVCRQSEIARERQACRAPLPVRDAHWSVGGQGLLYRREALPRSRKKPKLCISTAITSGLRPASNLPPDLSDEVA